jgi:hypothetical protein
LRTVVIKGKFLKDFFLLKFLILSFKFNWIGQLRQHIGITIGAVAFSIMTLGITTLSIMGWFATLGMNDC